MSEFLSKINRLLQGFIDFDGYEILCDEELIAPVQLTADAIFFSYF